MRFETHTHKKGDRLVAYLLLRLLPLIRSLCVLICFGSFWIFRQVLNARWSVNLCTVCNWKNMSCDLHSFIQFGQVECTILLLACPSIWLSDGARARARVHTTLFEPWPSNRFGYAFQSNTIARTTCFAFRSQSHSRLCAMSSFRQSIWDFRSKKKVYIILLFTLLAVCVCVFY